MNIQGVQPQTGNPQFKGYNDLDKLGLEQGGKMFEAMRYAFRKTKSGEIEPIIPKILQKKDANFAYHQPTDTLEISAQGQTKTVGAERFLNSKELGDNIIATIKGLLNIAEPVNKSYV